MVLYFGMPFCSDAATIPASMKERHAIADFLLLTDCIVAYKYYIGTNSYRVFSELSDLQANSQEYTMKEDTESALYAILGKQF